MVGTEELAVMRAVVSSLCSLCPPLDPGLGGSPCIPAASHVTLCASPPSDLFLLPPL